MTEAPPAKRLKVDEALHVPVATGAPQTEPQLPIHPIYKIELPPAASPPDPNRDIQIYRLTQFIREAEMAYLNRLSSFPLKHNVELEFRIGYTNPQTTTFVPSLYSQELFHMLKAVFGRLLRRSSNNEEATDANLTALANQRKIRWKCDSTNPPTFEEKHKLAQGSLLKANDAQIFSTRLAANVESGATMADIPHSAEVVVRKKMRRKFYPYKVWVTPPPITDTNMFSATPILVTEMQHPLRDAVRIDLTEVRQVKCSYNDTFTSSNLDFNTNGSTYELEIELMPVAVHAMKFGSKEYDRIQTQISYPISESYGSSVICRPDAASHPRRTAIIAHLVDFMRDLHMLISQVSMDCKFSDVFLHPVTLNSTYHSILANFNQALNRVDHDSAFPGCMPVGFFKKHIPVVKEKKYFVSEKSDGLRFLMFFTKDRSHDNNHGAIYLINRSMQFFQVRGRICSAFVNAVANDGDTIVDGELVRNSKILEPLYLAYDVLQFNDIRLIDSPYSTRLKFVKQFSDKWTEISPPGCMETVAFPFRVSRKTIVPAEQIESVFSRILEYPNHDRIYKDGAMNHHHPTDGLIFCPDSPYEFGTQQSLMKWKFVDKLTVDLRIEFVRNAPSTLLLWCNGRRDPFTAHMLPEDMYHLQKELASVSHGQAVIGEFGLEGQQWRFHLIRKDKNEPNHVNTVNDTLAAIEENLTALVLQAAFASQTAPQSFLLQQSAKILECNLESIFLKSIKKWLSNRIETHWVEDETENPGGGPEPEVNFAGARFGTVQ